MKKKILFISANDHSCLSGADIYTKKVMQTLLATNKYEIDEVSFEFNLRKNIILDKIPEVKVFTCYQENNYIGEKYWFFKYYWSFLFKTQKLIRKLEPQYDLIIDGTVMMFRSKKIKRMKKYIYIEHQDPEFFKFKNFLWLRYVAQLAVRLAGYTNTFKQARNIFFHDISVLKYWEKKLCRWKQNEYLATACYYTEYTKKDIERFWSIKQQVFKNNEFINDITYIGRLVKWQKRLNYLTCKHVNFRFKVNFYGSGVWAAKIKNSPHNLHGFINHNQVDNILSKSKFTILCSSYEGCPLSVSESIATCTPVVSSRSSIGGASLIVDDASAKFSIGDRGILFSTYKRAAAVEKIIYDFSLISNEKLYEYSKNCYEFAIKNLCVKKFEKTWIDYVDQVLKFANVSVKNKGPERI